MREKRYGEEEEKRYFESIRRNEHISHLESQLAIAREGLLSIAKNSCCKPCQEAKLVAQSVLAALDGKAGVK